MDALGKWKHMISFQVQCKSIEQFKNGHLMYLMDYTTQLYMDYNKPWNKDPVMKQSV